MVSIMKEQGWSLNEIFFLPTQLRTYHCELIKERLEEKIKAMKGANKR